MTGTALSTGLDLLNAAISLARGNYHDAAMYGLFALPFIGDVAAAGRLGMTFAKRASTGRGLVGLGLQGAAQGTLQLAIIEAVSWMAGGGANSFAAGTGVVTGVDEHGNAITKNIEDLQVGDVVLAQDELNPDADPHYALVTGVSSRTVYEVHHLTYTDAQGNAETLQTTANHEFFAITPNGEARWTTAEQLEAGDQLLLPDASVATVTANTEVLVPEGIEVYNLTVSDGATYFVDDGQGHASAVWVHNCNAATLRLARQLGLAGEQAAKIVKNTKRIDSITGTRKFRIPDSIDKTAKLVIEVKNVKKLAFTSQIQDSLYFAMGNGYTLVLKVRAKNGNISGTVLSQPLKDVIGIKKIRLEFI